jgi:DASS family divalent anion:Na+ symporter
MPIARSVAELHGSYPGPTAALLGSFLMTGVYQSICVTAAMFMTGQASNPLAASIATETLHYPVTLVSWFVAGIVPGLCSLLIVPAVVYRLNPPQIRRTPEARAFAASELTRMGPMDGAQRTVFLVFVAVCGLWVTTAVHHIDITITALLGAVALLLSGVLKWEQVAGNKAAWNLFIWYGGLVRLGHALGDAGVAKAFASGVAGMLPGARWMVLLAVVLAIYFYSHYGFASITAHLLSMFVPFGSLLIVEGAPPGLVVFSLACFTNLSAGLTHYGTTPAPMFFAQHYVSLREWWKTGFVISLVNLAIWSTVGFAWWKVIKVW